MPLFQDTYCNIVHGPATGLLTLTWLATTSEMSDEGFQTANMALAVLADEHKALGLLVDVRQFGFSFGEGLGAWRDRNIIPIYTRAGVRKMAFLHRT